MFESLSDRLQAVFSRLSSKGRLSEEDVDEALKEVRRALLEADVNFKVVKEFVARIRERAVGEQITKSLTPAQMVVKIVNEELTAVLGGEEARLNFAPRPPTIFLMVGLQGSGKTTHCAKLALHLKEKGRHPLLATADLQRAAAVEQLQALRRLRDAERSIGSVRAPDAADPHALRPWVLSRRRRRGSAFRP